MPDLDLAREAPHKVVFDTLEDTTAGMLWVEDSRQHPQPMTHFVERDAGELWYITDRNSDLVAAVGQGAQARLTVVSTHQDVYLSLLGPIEQVDNPARLEEMWSPMVSAFFEGANADEADALLLRLTLREAALWASPRNPVVFGLRLLRATAGGSSEDLGFHTVLNFTD
ncbi:pyridoxamine 5'-phosphate oxidase family protein [Tropicimonas isoalkanivorans]|uniref:General stress protein 26 n=1 Tax=Tropicimonas isoalkanivorans TaxID=441112 RepID=A0A1I1P1U4_9RHOB|nr:pyridoxamine 5'-phosphate oxidase family protein [Tropicimonas isoalkanivorans]SFD03532.1 General stress protein 26 [Tropicimonas isoalkanivorans]